MATTIVWHGFGQELICFCKFALRNFFSFSLITPFEISQRQGIISLILKKKNTKYLQKNSDLYPVSHLPTFYKQIIFYWQDIATATPKNKGRVLSQPIWNNRFLTVNKKMVFFPHWYQAGIKQISDLFYSCEGHFLPFNSFCNKLNVKCNFL